MEKHWIISGGQLAVPTLGNAVQFQNVTVLRNDGMSFGDVPIISDYFRLIKKIFLIAYNHRQRQINK